MPNHERVLVLCFSPLARDARVLRQVAALREKYLVTTCGYGPAPYPDVEHVRLPDGLTAWKLNRALLILRRFHRAYWSQESVAAAKDALRGRTFDAIVADDVETVPLALSLNPTGGVLADLHEYSPRLKENLPRWRFFVGPYMRWLCRSAVTRAKRVSTVCEGLANEYHREFGFLPSVVTNAAPFRDASPTPVSNPIRLVHSGAAMPDRELEVMVDAVAKLNTRTPGRFLFDLYLTPNNPNYVAKLRERVADSPFIQILDPVSASELREKLATYDVGLFACPDTTFSLRHALPNKFFDYVQARLGIVISPSPEMSRLLNRHKLGVVSTTFEAESFANALDTLTPEKVAEYKLASHSAAQELSGENQVPVFLSLVEQILRREN